MGKGNLTPTKNLCGCYLREQILNGISQDEFVGLTGEPMVKFYNYDSAAPVSYEVNGNLGVKAGLKDAMEEKVGQVVGFFLLNFRTFEF